MTISDHLEQFHGLDVVTFPGPDESTDRLPEADAVAWRLTADPYDAEEQWQEAFARFLSTVDPSRVRALVVGSWPEAYEESSASVVEALVAARERLPALRGLFLGDITGEECEISWIVQSTVTPLLEHFPLLEELGVRGGTNLVFPAVRHERLRRLTIEAGGLPAEVVQGVVESVFPALERLELWLGTSDYGGTAEVADLAPLLSGDRLPQLRHLGLRNSEIQDEICVALASAPVVARLETLDLSMGVLGDDGATALLTGQPLGHLKRLDLHYNFLSEELCTRLRETLEPSGVELDLSSENAENDVDGDGTEWRFVSVSE
ncbi:STM4015 family protein [Streptomyces sp. NPDC005438]|uniref:STM4015 family protein n=1 Tax=Streptomyces sp. NPDC005438 TaxID=3156880 RepID=UPI0033BC97E4